LKKDKYLKLKLKRHSTEITLCGVERGQVGDMCPGAQALDMHQHTLFRHLKKRVFRQKCRPKYA